MSRVNDILRTRRILLLMFGAPGTGKGTFGKQLASDYGFIHVVTGMLLTFIVINTGDLLRNASQRDSVVAHQIRDIISQGSHVEDGLICNIVRNEITACSMGTILDGTPRTSGQALFVKSLADSLGFQVLGADLSLDRDILIERLLGRRHCAVCKRTYNLCTINRDGHIMDALLPSKSDIEKCKGCSNLEMRSDDTREIIEHRLDLYDNTHMNVLASLAEVPIMRFSIRKGLGDYLEFKNQLDKFLEDHLL
ncbi:nucleoside monophosphate kinase [Babesia divergens]|uniref:Nucleoside monophosphate kinase n=1 Tax=Babesia divergens TaxID=32595 RepID=A0AAD9LGK9_BABDI|nr:nucleoside monophosphate kinase [Babesia divergens]